MRGQVLLLCPGNWAHVTGTVICRRICTVWAPAQNSTGKTAETWNSPEGSERRGEKGSGGLILMGKAGGLPVCVVGRGMQAELGWGP